MRCSMLRCWGVGVFNVEVLVCSMLRCWGVGVFNIEVLVCVQC